MINKEVYSPMPPRGTDEHIEWFSEDLKDQVERSREQMAFRDARVNEFKEEFGDELGTASLAYARRSGLEETILMEGKYHPTDEVRSLYAKGIIEGLSQQPEDKREEWLTTLLEKQDKLQPPK